MNKAANTPRNNPEVAGLGEENTATNEETIPCTYFAGARRLKLLWIMDPVDRVTKKSKNSTPAKK